MNKNFDRTLSEAIDTVSQDVNQTDPIGPITSLVDLLQQIRNAEESIKTIKTQVRHLTEQVVAGLGTEIRKRQPGIDIGLNSGRCTCGYRSRLVECTPDVENGVWEITGSPFARKFTRTYPHLLKLNDDVTPLAHALADFFNKHYKRLSSFE